MLDILAEAPTATGWLANKTPVLKGEKGDVSLSIALMRKDVMSAVATGALSGLPMPLSSGTLASFSAAIARGLGDADIGELPRFFREFMAQNFK
jgi:3-hydroxyisobutyrate dehydrogenase-like beta-hydroxyacid dehydrogenase